MIRTPLTLAALTVALPLALSGCANEPEPLPVPSAQSARALAEAASDDDFTVPMNELVLEKLQTYTRVRRDFVAGALTRMQDADDVIAPVLEERGLPSELIAVAMCESGFQEIEARPPAYPGGGTWQFISRTAREYGLRVDDEVDERYDLAASTGAAASLLSDLHDEFGDWGLAFAGYNQGEHAVRAAIEAGGTDDVWELIRQDRLNPYAADVMACVVLVEQSEALGF